MNLSANKISNINIGFTSLNAYQEELKKHPVVIDNTISNRMYISWDKLTNALTMYPARGLKGSKNSNFYEFLTMGTVPYLTGSLTLMAVFNYANKFFAARDKAVASKFGNKMALGVLFYGLAKNFSKNFITLPVKWTTGIDTEEPYAELKYKLPESKNDTDITSLEYHKVLESLEFPRWDVKYGDDAKGEKRNVWFDKIAKKIKLGDNLNDSDQDVKPRVKEIAAKTSVAKAFSSYMWAAVGVGMAIQNTWDEFFSKACYKPWKIKQFASTVGDFCNSLCTSAKELYKGPKDARTFFTKHSGKMLLGAAAVTTIIGLLNAIISRHRPSKLTADDVINRNKPYVEN